MIVQLNWRRATIMNKIPQKIVALKTRNRFTRNTLYFFFDSLKHAVILLPSYIFSMCLPDN